MRYEERQKFQPSNLNSYLVSHISNMLSIKIAGPAGFGIKVTGQILAKVFLRLGADVFAYTEYPSLIRGGHNTFQVDLAASQIHPERAPKGRVEGSPSFLGVNSPASKVDILIALTPEAIEKEKNNLKKDGLVIYDETIKDISVKADKLPLPLVEFAKKHGGELMKNTVALGALFGILVNVIPRSSAHGATRDLVVILNEVIEDTFGHKGDAVKQNIAAAREGFEFIKNNKIETKTTRSFDSSLSLLAQDKLEKILVSGNQAMALGAMAAGCQVYSAYPMTPASEILHFLEAKQKETGMIVHQGEDEIAVIHTAIGASFAGARAACGTSGGGFALMTEGLSLAAQVETPLVIFEIMRPAPATGLPTWTEQGDLQFVLHAGHGDFARAILAPGNPAECFELTQKAFNLADKFQIPIFVMSDKFLGESYYTVDGKTFNEIEKKVSSIQYQVSKKNEGLFARYQITKNGISPRVVPGVEGGEHIANSDEHNEFGLSTESREVRKEQMDKRLKKLAELKKEIPLPTLYGPKKAKTTLVCWGSMLGPCLDAMNFCHSGPRAGIQDSISGSRVKPGMTSDINVLHFNYVYPLPNGLEKFLKNFNKLVLVENNAVGQFGQLLRQETGIEIEKKILKYDGRAFWSDEINELL